MGELTEADVWKIEQIHSDWIEFEVAGEDHSLLALCADDIELWPPNAQPRLGRAAVSAQMAHGTKRIHSIGTQTQAEILSHAVKIASVEGLAGLTIGRLAQELRMSKSGLFAHFRSKQRLELATIDRAWEILADEVLVPGKAAREGI